VNLNIGILANNIAGGSNTIKKVSGPGAASSNAVAGKSPDKLSPFTRPGTAAKSDEEKANNSDSDVINKDEKQKQEKLINDKPEDAGNTAKNTVEKFTKASSSAHPELSEGSPKAEPTTQTTTSPKPNISDITGKVKDSRNPEQSEGSNNSKTNNDLQYDNKALENMGSNKDNRFGDAMKESPKSTSPDAVAKDYGFITPDNASGAGSAPSGGN
jgi:hypothetical protein